MNAVSYSNWQKPGKTLQEGFARYLAEVPERDASGRFVRKPTLAELTLKSLRRNYAPPQVEPRISEAPLDAVEGESRRRECTGARRESGETNWRATGDSISFLVPETDAKTVPHPSIMPRFTRQRIINAGLAVACFVVMAIDPDPLVSLFASLYGLGNALMAWEGK